MEVSRFHRWWLGACILATVVANWAGGFSVAVTAVFLIIYLAGAALIRQGESGRESESEPESESEDQSAEPYPRDDSDDDSGDAQPAAAESESSSG